MSGLMGLVLIGVIVVGILYAVGIIPGRGTVAHLSHVYGVGVSASVPTMSDNVSGKKTLTLTFIPTEDGTGNNRFPQSAELSYVFSLLSEDRKTIYASGQGSHPTNGETITITHDLNPTDSGHLGVEASLLFKDGSKSMTGTLVQQI